MSLLVYARVIANNRGYVVKTHGKCGFGKRKARRLLWNALVAHYRRARTYCFVFHTGLYDWAMETPVGVRFCHFSEGVSGSYQNDKSLAPFLTAVSLSLSLSVLVSVSLSHSLFSYLFPICLLVSPSSFPIPMA